MIRHTFVIYVFLLLAASSSRGVTYEAPADVVGWFEKYKQTMPSHRRVTSQFFAPPGKSLAESDLLERDHRWQILNDRKIGIEYRKYKKHSEHSRFFCSSEFGAGVQEFEPDSGRWSLMNLWDKEGLQKIANVLDYNERFNNPLGQLIYNDRTAEEADVEIIDSVDSEGGKVRTFALTWPELDQKRDLKRKISVRFKEQIGWLFDRIERHPDYYVEEYEWDVGNRRIAKLRSFNQLANGSIYNSGLSVYDYDTKLSDEEMRAQTSMEYYNFDPPSTKKRSFPFWLALAAILSALGGAFLWRRASR